VRAGTRSLKTSGSNGVGVDGLAAAAGVTSGAFYSNFPNKTAMLEAVIEAGLGEPFVSATGAQTILLNPLGLDVPESRADGTPCRRSDSAVGLIDDRLPPRRLPQTLVRRCSG
jgi:AcrR family transcriptional regulator